MPRPRRTGIPEQGPLLEARDLVAGYLPGVDILQGCSLEVGQDEIVGVIGPNGAGKSTLVK
ncbi:MAG: ATP-binding cassette domain-containing protein, partial [Gaiellales bacterium]